MLALARRRVKHGWAMALIRERVARRRLSSARADIVIQHGTEVFLGKQDVPLVTYEDSTLAGAMAKVDLYAHLKRASARDLRAQMTRSRKAYDAATLQCFCSTWAAESAVSEYQLNQNQVQVVGVGRNYDLVRCNHDWSRPAFVWIGREWVRKGGPQLLAAFEALRSRYPEAELKLIGSYPAHLGSGVTGLGEPSLGSSEAVEVIGEALAWATCLAVPSLHEPAGSVFSEAGSVGIGSIGGASGGSASIIGAGGLTVQAEDVGALEAAMLAFAVPSQAMEFGRLAYLQSNEMTWSKVAQRLLTACGRHDRDGMLDQ